MLPMNPVQDTLQRVRGEKEVNESRPCDLRFFDEAAVLAQPDAAVAGDGGDAVGLQQRADEATFERRALAVEKESSPSSKRISVKDVPIPYAAKTPRFKYTKMT